MYATHLEHKSVVLRHPDRTALQETCSQLRSAADALCDGAEDVGAEAGGACSRLGFRFTTGLGCLIAHTMRAGEPLKSWTVKASSLLARSRTRLEGAVQALVDVALGRALLCHPPEEAKSPVSDPRFVLSVAKIRRLVVQIKAFAKDDLMGVGDLKKPAASSPPRSSAMSSFVHSIWGFQGFRVEG